MVDCMSRSFYKQVVPKVGVFNLQLHYMVWVEFQKTKNLQKYKNRLLRRMSCKEILSNCIQKAQNDVT